MILSESLTTPPALEPITADEVKQSARIDDDRFDAEIPRLIEQARETVEQETGRRMIAQTWTLELDAWPEDGGAIALPQSPVLEVDEITYWDGATWATLDAAGYKLLQRPCQMAAVGPAFNAAWPALGDEVGARVRVAYVAGYGDEPAEVPAGVRQWMLAHCAHWIAHPAASTDREAPPNPYLARLLDRTRAYA